MSLKLKTLTLGCKVNQYETQLVREGLLSAGYLDAQESERADVCVVNTCTVTAEGDAKGRQAIRRLHRENPDARIIVMGCYATRAPEEVRGLPGVVEVVTDKREIPDLLGRHGVMEIPRGITGLSGRSRAFVKIQDGCLLRCTYCIIPSVRPHMYSRPTAEVVQEIAELIDHGYSEIVLTGIHLGHYGVDFNRGQPREHWVRLAGLLRCLMELPGDFRLRLSSIEATEVTRELVEVMAAHPDRIAPHLHVCLQSGSDRILRAMHRRWNAKRIVDRCRWVAERLELPAFTTDVIVGFPGETAQDFQHTLDVCREISFSKIHIFPFSRRKGTPAFDMPDQVAAEIKQARCEELAALERNLQQEYWRQLVGRELTVLVENQSAAFLQGTTCRFATCQIPVTEPTIGQSPNMLGRLVRAQIADVSATGLTATQLPRQSSDEGLAALPLLPAVT